MIEHCTFNLDQLKSFLSSIDNENYTFHIHSLGNSSIGQHTRHILEFYHCLITGCASAKVDYDSRERSMTLETSTFAAIEFINEISAKLANLSDKNIELFGDFSIEGSLDNNAIQSSVYRELAYCLEHSIHHQALIKVALIELKQVSIIDDTFGVAPATIRHRTSCVQ
jgi:uncharacterized damage-inducible protein DinB